MHTEWHSGYSRRYWPSAVSAPTFPCRRAPINYATLHSGKLYRMGCWNYCRAVCDHFRSSAYPRTTLPGLHFHVRSRCFHMFLSLATACSSAATRASLTWGEEGSVGTGACDSAGGANVLFPTTTALVGAETARRRSRTTDAELASKICRR